MDVHFPSVLISAMDNDDGESVRKMVLRAADDSNGIDDQQPLTEVIADCTPLCHTLTPQNIKLIYHRLPIACYDAGLGEDGQSGVGQGMVSFGGAGSGGVGKDGVGQ